MRKNQLSRPASPDQNYQLIILGGGPAGLTCGLYTARARLKTLLIERSILGGLVTSTDWIENYPGFPDGIKGAELMERFERQARRFGLEILMGEPSNLDLTGPEKRIRVGAAEFRAQAVVIATGTRPKELGIPGERELRGRGVSYCATCDGPLFKDKHLVVVGCGSSGLQEGLSLRKFARQIDFVEFLDRMTGEPILQERIRSQPNASIHLGYEVLAIEGQSRVTGVRVRNRTTLKESRLEAQGVFIYAGLIPQTDFLKGQVELDEEGYLVTDERLATSRDGVFGAGDVRNKSLRQIATAIGDGALAAHSVQSYLEEQSWR
jgi:thioredoxin reductase (NADPH)